MDTIADKLLGIVVNTWEWSWRLMITTWTNLSQHKKVGVIVMVTGFIIGTSVSLLMTNVWLGSFLSGIIFGMGLQMFTGVTWKHEQENESGDHIDVS